MSIALMTEAFKSDLPLARKMVLLALCDNANDQGECYPSVSMLVGKCSMSDRAIQIAIVQLEKDGYLKRDFRKGRSTLYVITNSAFWPKSTPEPRSPHPRTTFTPEPDSPPNDVHPTPERGSPPPPNVVHPTPEPRSPITIIEPSIEPSGNRNKRETADFDPAEELRKLGVSDQAAKDWLKIRKAKSAPLTKTALAGMDREAKKAGLTLPEAVELCAERGWQALRAEWLQDKRAPPGRTTEEQRRADNEEAYRLLFGKKPSEVIDV